MKQPTHFATEDQSSTLFSDLYGEHYHSIHGAINESQHIFIDGGLKSLQKSEISIFEMGFGTGLNAFLSLEYALKHELNIKYTTLEKHPVASPIYTELNYGKEKGRANFIKLHELEWESFHKINEHFSFSKHAVDLLDYKHKEQYDLVYFDAFSPDSQPELWSESVFKAIYEHMNPAGILMTYSVKGIVKRALKAVGFKIEKIPGPIGKREILRATK